MILAVLLVLLTFLALVLGTTRLGCTWSFRTVSKFMALPQVPGVPFFSKVFELASLDSVGDIPNWLQDIVEKRTPIEGVALFFFGGYPVFLTNKAEEYEVVMSSTKYIDKGPLYHLLRGWLNDGLILSKGDKWKQRRRLLTPSFHFKILDNNMDSLNRHWRGVARKFLAHKGAPLDPNKYLCRGTLDVIAETAMGIKLDETAGCEEYVKAVRSSADILGFRASKPEYYSALIFWYFSRDGWDMRTNLKTLHNFTRKIIKRRREAYCKGSHSADIPSETKKSKRPQPFLDALIELDLEQKGILSDSDIQEEVDTFMFEGHDTTACALLFAFFELGLNPHVQDKAYQEQFDIFGDDDREATMEDLAKMNYLEQVIKEVLRLYPPVAYMSRILTEECTLTNGLVLPKDTVINIFPHLVHRNAKYYPNPTVFDPERFSPEQIKNRHPYAFIPFSAGPRNCIGQRFAMMELKTALSTMLRLTKIKTLNRREDIKLHMLVILRPSDPISVEVTPRHQ